MIRTLTIGAIVIGTAMGAAYLSGLRCNTTPSMPMGVWRVQSIDTTVRRGEVVTLCLDPSGAALGRARGYISGGECPGNVELLIKTVAAVPGDEVEIRDDGVAVNGSLIPNSRALSRDDQGRPMQAIAPGVYRVADHQVWVVASHDPRSYDSRYIGPIPTASITGSARPLLVR